jgi:hypothetical protein
MQGVELLVAGGVLLGTVMVGLVAHELMHALVLHVLGVPYEIEWFPGRGRSTRLTNRLSGTWASVTPREVPARVPTWGIQLSAVAPALLASPLLLVALGVVPSPLAANNAYATAWTVAWLACSIPSPQDFSVFWHADVVISEYTDSPTAGD